MAHTALNKLFFVKFVGSSRAMSDSVVVSLQTARDDAEALEKGWAFINEPYRELYRVAEVTFVCNTPDEVTNFEPC